LCCLCGSLETYQPLLRAVANEFGIPVFFSHADALVESPSILSLLNLLSLPLEDYKTRALMNALHSPYLDFGLDGRAIEDLEKVIQEASIVKGRDQWEDAWKMLERIGSNDSDYVDEERQVESLTGGINLPVLREAFGRFWHIFDSITQVRSLSEWVAWLETLLEGLHFREKISRGQDQDAYESLGEALQALI